MYRRHFLRAAAAMPPAGPLLPINFFMYPEAHSAAGPLDGVDPDSFAYKITVRELKAA